MKALTRRISSRSLSSSIFNLNISHFSSHHSSRRYDDEARNVRVSVWWDFENIHLPTAVSPYQVAHRITAALRANGIKGPLQISAYGNVTLLTRSIQGALSSTGISLIHVPAGGKNGADRSLIIDLLYWVSQHPPPAHLFLISGDSDFASILHRLRMSNYNILVANGKYVSNPLCSAASIVWQWNTLLKGENLSGRRFNQPPDGPVGSWYGNSRLPLESLFTSLDQPASLVGNGSSDSESENVLRPIPTDAVNQIRQILSSHPSGVAISTLRQELNNTMMLADDLYGYKKFSVFLSAMSDILTMHSLGDGQYLVCGIKPIAPSSPDSSMNSSERSIVDESDNHTPLKEIELHDGSSSLKLEDKNHASDSPILSSDEDPQSCQLREYFDTQIVEHPSSATCNEEPSIEGQGQGPLENEKDAVGSCRDHSAVIKKENVSEEDSFFQRTWTKLFSGHDDRAMSSQENNKGKQTPTSLHSPTFSAPVGNPEKSNYDGEDRKKRGFFIHLVNWFKFDNYKAETESEASNSEYLKHNTLLKDSCWAKIKLFLDTPQGADIISKSKSRLQIAQILKKVGPATLHSFDKNDILHLVDILIDDKRWVEECPCEKSPFRVICVSGKSFSNNPWYSSASSLRFVGKQPQSDLQKLPKHEGEITNRVSSSGICLPGDNKRSLEKTRSRMISDCRKLLKEIVKEHPHGYSLRGFRKLFAERYSYNLNLEALGYETLAAFVKKIPGVTVEGAFVYPWKRNTTIADISRKGGSDSEHQMRI
uniref:HTH OST-type domain-containing protein n=1 Tax=Kalanchoe fedtschenkoi TaxID=63787 RepID=A0A7N0TWG9_KALFE